MINQGHSPQDDDIVLPLPSEAGEVFHVHKGDKTGAQAAADLIRKKVELAYGASEPSVAAEAEDLRELRPKKKSPHQQYIYELTGSGKSLAEIQAAWHEYYNGLNDAQKHEVWQEFYDTHSKASVLQPHIADEQPIEPKPPQRIVAASQRPLPPKRTKRISSELKNLAITNAPRRRKMKVSQPLQSMFFGLGVGSIVLLVFMFSFFNERFIAPFIQPSRNVTNTPIISDGAAIGTEPKIVIPKINVEIPVVYGVNTIEEDYVQKALEDGVVHYADTAHPGENGNSVIVGHSSNNLFNKGKYKFAFVLLSRMENGDTFYLHKDGKRYTYQVYKKEVVSPTDVSVLSNTEKTATATLITCDPPGSTAKRLVVVGEQISPDPSSNIARSTDNTQAAKAAIIPGNAPSLWSRFTGWFTGP